jgi:hypothetical protein
MTLVSPGHFEPAPGLGRERGTVAASDNYLSATMGKRIAEGCAESW